MLIYNKERRIKKYKTLLQFYNLILRFQNHLNGSLLFQDSSISCKFYLGFIFINERLSYKLTQEEIDQEQNSSNYISFCIYWLEKAIFY